jgi:hypothetical protein
MARSRYIPISAAAGTDNSIMDGTASNRFTVTSITLGTGQNTANYRLGEK